MALNFWRPSLYDTGVRTVRMMMVVHLEPWRIWSLMESALRKPQKQGFIWMSRKSFTGQCCSSTLSTARQTSYLLSARTPGLLQSLNVHPYDEGRPKYQITAGIWFIVQSAPIMGYERFLFWFWESPTTGWHACKVKKHFYCLLICIYVYLICSTTPKSFIFPNPSFAWR